MHALVAYASVHGSTAEVARFIAQVLARRGIANTVASAASVDERAHYDAFVLGSAVSNGLWLPEMESFVRRLHRQLVRAPFYLWLNCLRVVEPGGLAHVMQNYVPDMLAGQPVPRSIGVFGGRFDPAAIKPGEQWILTFHYDGAQLPSHLSGDHRDWSAIRSWAETVGTDLRA